MNQPQHLRAVGVNSNEVRLEVRPVQRRDADVIVSSGLELPSAGFEMSSRCLVLAVHADRSEAMQIFVVRTMEAESDGGQRANNVVPPHGNTPSVAARHPDRLTHDPLLVHGLAGHLHAFGNRLASLEHADGQWKGVRPHITREHLVEQPQS